MTEVYEFTFGSDLIAAPSARAFVRERLGPDHSCLDDALNVAAELVGNVLRHTKGGGALELAFTLERVELRVKDTSRGKPQVKAPSTDDECWRGLRVIDALAEEWGCEPAAAPYEKVVYVRLHTPCPTFQTA